MNEKKTNLVEIEMTFKTSKEAATVGDVIHNYLAGLQDYVDNSVLLNITDCNILLIIGDEASDKAKAGILGLNILKATQK